MQHPLSAASPACGGDPPGFAQRALGGCSSQAPLPLLRAVSVPALCSSKPPGFGCPRHPRPLCEAGRDASASLGGQGRCRSEDQGKSSHLHALENTQTNKERLLNPKCCKAAEAHAAPRSLGKLVALGEPGWFTLRRLGWQSHTWSPSQPFPDARRNLSSPFPSSLLQAHPQHPPQLFLPGSDGLCLCCLPETVQSLGAGTRCNLCLSSAM